MRFDKALKMALVCSVNGAALALIKAVLLHNFIYISDVCARSPISWAYSSASSRASSSLLCNMDGYKLRSSIADAAHLQRRLLAGRVDAVIANRNTLL